MSANITHLDTGGVDRDWERHTAYWNHLFSGGSPETAPPRPEPPPENDPAMRVEMEALRYKYRDILAGTTPTAVAVLEAKTVATLQARAALAGWQLVQMPAGDFVAERWGALRALPDLTAVVAFLKQVGAPA